VKFKLMTKSLEEFLKGIRNIEQASQYSNVNYKQAKDIDSHEKIGFNVNAQGYKIFSLVLKDDKKLELNHPASKIPLGNYYIEFYSYKNVKGKVTQFVFSCVDLRWNINNTISREGYQPLYLFVKHFKDTYNENDKVLALFHHTYILYLSVIDRLKQICYVKRGIPDGSLLAESVNYSLNKYCERSLGNKDNYRKKIMNRVVIIPENKDNSGSWQWTDNTNRRSTFSDCFNDSNAIDMSVVKEIFNAYNDEIILGESSEESVSKGVFVFLNEDLQKIRNPNEKTYDEGYEGLAYLVKNSETISIFTEDAKHSARSKTHMSSNCAAASNLSLQKVYHDDNDKFIFDRHRCYLSHNPEKIGQIARSELNVLAVYVPTDSSATEISIQDFNNIDKNVYSRLIDGADCHIKIAKEVSEIPVVNSRTASFAITEENFSFEFKSLINQLEKDSDLRIEPDFIIAYKNDCENPSCRNTMSPVKVISKSSDGEIEFEHIAADKDVRDWICNVCGSYLKKEAMPVKINDKYKSAISFKVKDIIFDLNTKVSILVDITSPIGISRCISEEGVKGQVLPVHQDYVGYINGEIYDLKTDSYKTIDLTPVDILMNLGSMKGKLSGIAVSHIRMINAFTSNNYCLNKDIKDSDNIDHINEFLSKCKKVTLNRKAYNPVTNKFEFKTEEVYAGIISLMVTELSDEYFKVKTELQDMKVSHQNSIFYDWLGYKELSKALIDDSFATFYDKNNLDFTLSLFKMYYSDSTDLIQAFRSIKEEKDQSWSKTINDFDNPKGTPQIVSWLSKEDWIKVLDNHPLLQKDNKFDKGAYFIDKEGKTIVFPNRDTILRLVDIIDGGKVRIHLIVKLALSLFLDVYTKGFIEPLKIDRYKSAIYDKLTGKQGIFARASTFVNYGFNGKITGSGYLPTGTVVVGDRKFWSVMRKNFEKIDITLDKINSGEQSLYAPLQRDPKIWIFQALNSVQVWTVTRANKYFKENYGTSFNEIYPDFTGLMVNPLDLIYLKQGDADGDPMRLIIPFSIKAQKYLALMNNSMKNYDLICKANPDTVIGHMYQKVGNWHFDYLKAEVISAAKRIDESLFLKVKAHRVTQKNYFIVKGGESKGNIAKITTAQWKIQMICDYLFRKKISIFNEYTKELFVLTEKDRNAISLFYQTCFTQDGCVRSLKGDKNLGEYNLNMIALNADVEDNAYGVNKKVPIREKVLEEAIVNGYEDIVYKFFAITDYWKQISGIYLQQKKNGEKGSRIFIGENVLQEAKMINAYIAVANGSIFSGKNKFEMFEHLAVDDSKYILERAFIEPIISYLKKISYDNSLRKKIKDQKN